VLSDSRLLGVRSVLSRIDVAFTALMYNTIDGVIVKVRPDEESDSFNSIGAGVATGALFKLTGTHPPSLSTFEKTHLYITRLTSCLILIKFAQLEGDPWPLLQQPVVCLQPRGLASSPSGKRTATEPVDALAPRQVYCGSPSLHSVSIYHRLVWLPVRAGWL
jgi:hypothetical protein